ncbi:hypothetical protein AVEN_133857-1 [Araneus ventricosus]|uniref:Uncharacterized protein n=1 Tax=Araneus ventricosus TaxID=182803 RepID=A0A4Y2N8X9_ARAVE|nr:hypothetical protein AVEN_133857-1 [Araneus ventricosus]
MPDIVWKQFPVPHMCPNQRFGEHYGMDDYILPRREGSIFDICVSFSSRFCTLVSSAECSEPNFAAQILFFGWTFSCEGVFNAYNLIDRLDSKTDPLYLPRDSDTDT